MELLTQTCIFKFSLVVALLLSSRSVLVCISPREVWSTLFSCSLQRWNVCNIEHILGLDQNQHLNVAFDLILFLLVG